MPLYVPAHSTPLIDSVTTVKVFAAGLGRVDIIGHNARLAWFVPEGEEGEEVRAIECYMTLPLEAIIPAIRMILAKASASLGLPAPSCSGCVVPRLLHS